MTKYSMPLLGEDIQGLLERLDDLQDRELAIIGIALVDSMLDAALRTRIGNKWSSDVERLAGTTGNKIHVSYILEMIPQRLFLDLCLLNNIRNKFAHRFLLLDFDTETDAIAGNCRSLKLPTQHEEIWHEIRTLNSASPESKSKRSYNDGYPDNAYYILDTVGAVLAKVVRSEAFLATNRMRFLSSIKLSWIFLATLCDPTRLTSDITVIPLTDNNANG